MHRRALLALPLLLAASRLARAQGAPPPAWQATAQDRADLARIEAYLNGLHTLKAHFLQVAPDGGLSEGTAWLERPGRMRFQYDPPAPFLLVAAHGLLVFRDSKLDQTSNMFAVADPARHPAGRQGHAVRRRDGDRHGAPAGPAPGQPGAHRQPVGRHADADLRRPRRWPCGNGPCWTRSARKPG